MINSTCFANESQLIECTLLEYMMSRVWFLERYKSVMVIHERQPGTHTTLSQQQQQNYFHYLWNMAWSLSYLKTILSFLEPSDTSDNFDRGLSLFLLRLFTLLFWLSILSLFQILLSHYHQKNMVPLLGGQCSSQKSPVLLLVLPSFHSFHRMKQLFIRSPHRGLVFKTFQIPGITNC